ncbi:hypothetical protein Efla_005440 [Eimeria flavescens]
MESSAAPASLTVAEFEALAAALHSGDSSSRQQAQQLLQKLQQQREDCGELCLAIISATNDAAAATVAAVLLRSAALWHWNVRLAAATAAKKRLAAAPPGEAAAAAGQASAAAAEALGQYVLRMQQLMSSVVLLLQQRAAAGKMGHGERQLSHSFCCLAKKGLATDQGAFTPAMKGILEKVVAKGPAEPMPLFWLRLLTETAQQMQQQQQQGMQLSLQQHAACCRSFQLQLLLPLVQFVLQRLQFILDHPQMQAAGLEEIAAIVGVLDVACSWSFGHLLLRLSTCDELSLAPPAEWIPVFFPAAAAAAGEGGGGGGGGAAAAGACEQQQVQQQQEGLFVLVFRLYKLLRGAQAQEPELFATVRYVLQRIAKFRPIAMADALLGEAGEEGALGGGPPSPVLPLKKSYSGPVGRVKKHKITSLVYVPLMGVLLDLLESCAFTERIKATAAAGGGGGGPQTQQGAPQTQQGAPPPGEQELEEVQDVCAALANLAGEGGPPVSCMHAPFCVPCFAAAAAPAAVNSVGLGLLELAAGDSAAAAAAAEALAVLLRAWSSWVSRLLAAAEQQASSILQPPPQQQQQLQQQQQQQQLRLSYVCRGLACCSQRDDEHEGVDDTQRKGYLFVLRGGSQLYEFLKALATMAQASPAQVLAAAAAKQQQLQQQLQQTRAAAAGAAAAAAAEGVKLQLRALRQQQQQQHWLLLYIQLLIVHHQGPEALANHRLAPPKQLLRDEAAQAELLRLLAAVFCLLEVEAAALKAAVADQQQQQQQQQQQLVLQVQQQLAAPVVLEVGLGVLSLVGKAYLLHEKLGKPVLADLLLPEGGLKVLNAGVAVAADCLLALPQHPALSLASARTLQVFADCHNPCSAYLWEAPAFQALIDCCCSCCAGLLQPAGSAAAATAASSPALPGDSSSNSSTSNSSSSSSSSVVLRHLSSQSCAALFAAFAAAAAPSEQLWGLAKRHVAQQQQQQQQQPIHRSGTLLGNEVATMRTGALLERCSVGLEVLQATAAAAAKGEEPLPIGAIRWVLSMLGGLALGAGKAGARRLLQWMGPRLRCAFAVTRAAAGSAEVLKDGLKFSRRIAAAGAGCLTQEEAQALLAEYCTVLAAFSMRLANAALEATHVLAMHAADLQLQQGHFTTSLENPEGAAALFVLSPQADALQQVYVHLAQLATALLQKLPSEQMTAAEQDVLGACLFAALFCVGVRAFALRHLLRCFASSFVAQGAGMWTGGCSSQNLQQRVEDLEAVVLAAIQEAAPAEGGAPQGASPGAPLPRFKQQNYHRREDAFKAELANFVAEFASFGPPARP